MAPIGNKFAGKQVFIDTENGIYWETLPKLQGHALCIQSALLNEPAGLLGWFKRLFHV